MVDRTTPFRILVVDDNEINQVVVCKFLQKLGCQVEVARNGRAAVDSIAHATFDAVLMDCEMPEMNGYEATQEIRRQEQSAGSRDGRRRYEANEPFNSQHKTIAPPCTAQLSASLNHCRDFR